MTADDLISKLLAEGKLLLRVSKAALLLDAHKSLVYELIAQKRVRAVKIGTELRVSVDEVLRLVREGTGDQ
jgi:excisionase family DNA binding protein